MRNRERDAASEPLSEEAFFESVPDAVDDLEDNIPFDLRPTDPILERKMTPYVRGRRRRLAGVVAAVVSCGALVLLAALAHVRLVVGSLAASSVAPAAEMHATVAAPAGHDAPQSVRFER